MYVIKRSGERERVSFDKVLDRIRRASSGLSVNPTRLAQLVLGDIHDGVLTQELDTLAAQLAISYRTLHPDWGTLAAQISLSNCQRSAFPTFSEAMASLMLNTSDKGTLSPILAPDVGEFIATHAAALDAIVNPSNDFLLDYFGFKTLERSYLQRSSADGHVIETPQYLWLRVAVGIWGSSHAGAALSTVERLARIATTYELMSTKAFTHATPTLFNAGTKIPQMSSCFLLGVEDSLRGMYTRLTDCAMISKFAGGVGIHVSDIRATGSHIAGTNGKSDGLVPFLKVYSDTSHHVNQSGRRNGSFAIYLEPWHADVEDFLKLKLGSGTEEKRARNLFYALWIPDLFMRRVEAGDNWSLFCPHEAPGLSDVVGPAFDALYATYEATPGLARKVIPAQSLWKEILASQIETGTPFLLYKDASNLKSNQKNLGTIKSSNLCTEIIEYSDSKEVAVCNLASIALPYCLEPCGCLPTVEGRPRHVQDAHSHTACSLFDDRFPEGADPTKPGRYEVFNFERLRTIVATLVRNLNRVIDINEYPVPEARTSNMRHRPIGIGVQGLADVFARMGLPWESPGAATLNREIFENIYYAAVDESIKMAVEDGPYETFAGSPASQGLLQPDLWGQAPERTAVSRDYLDWANLKTRMVRDGLRNSLLVAIMPTASTSQILGFNECIEPYTSNMYVRRTLAGEFTVMNMHLIADLLAAGLWTPEFKERLVAANGSIQDGFPEVSAAIKMLYKTVWEIPQRTLINMAADRGAYICQSQSLNLYVADPTIARLTSMHFHAWKMGLKTGVYYLRIKPKVNAIKFTVDPAVARFAADSDTSAGAGEPGECLMCSA